MYQQRSNKNVDSQYNNYAPKSSSTRDSGIGGASRQTARNELAEDGPHPDTPAQQSRSKQNSLSSVSQQITQISLPKLEEIDPRHRPFLFLGSVIGVLLLIGIILLIIMLKSEF